jgi:hypothetical protein
MLQAPEILDAIGTRDIGWSGKIVISTKVLNTNVSGQSEGLEIPEAQRFFYNEDQTPRWRSNIKVPDHLVID